MTNNVLLITEDDGCLFNFPNDYSLGYNMSLRTVGTFDEALEDLSRDQFSLLIIAMNDYKIAVIQEQIHALRGFTMIPIAILAKETIHVSDKNTTLLIGADQVLEMPVTKEEAAVLSYVLIRRYIEYDRAALPSLFHSNDLTINFNERKVFVGEKQIKLTKIEYGILSLLVQNRGNTTTYEQIYEGVWGKEYVPLSHDIVWRQVSNLRKALRVDASVPEYITIKRGIGYIFDPQQ